MSSGENKEPRRTGEGETGLAPRRFENFFDNFQRDMERMMRPWPMAMSWDFPSVFEARDTRMAPYDLVDKDDRYEIHLEVPGIEKEKIDVKTSKYSVEITAKHTEKTEEKGKRYLYSERIYRSFYRNILVPEEIVPSKVTAKVENGVLKLELPKKVPTRGEEKTKVDVR